MSTVAVVGSINADEVYRVDRLPRPGETVTARHHASMQGGKGANAAVACALSGARTALVGAVGDDAFGSAALDDLRSCGVDVSRVVRLRGHRTGTAIVSVAAGGENSVLVSPGANGALAPGHVDAALHALPHVGVVLTNLEIGVDAAEAALRGAAELGATAVLNPAPARDVPDRLFAYGPILTPNEHEASVLTGHEDPASAAAALQLRTRAPVIVTLGARGALVVQAGSSTVLPAPRVKAVDTTGAGDAFNGALVARLARGDALLVAVQQAVRTAARSTRYEGARPRRGPGT